jgi:hypothetical protein
MTDLNLYDLKSVHSRRTKTKKEIYNKIFKKVCKKIKQYNNQYFAKDCSYSVRSIQWGYPLFNVKYCIVYIMLQLKKKGFDVKYDPPNTIHISWNRALQKIEDKAALEKCKQRSKYSDHPAKIYNMEKWDQKLAADNDERERLEERKKYEEIVNDPSPPRTPSPKITAKERRRINKTNEIRDLIKARGDF